jgi:hypothetical protein
VRAEEGFYALSAVCTRSEHARPGSNGLDSKPDTRTISDPARAVAWDFNKALERLGGDEQLSRDVANIFLEETPKLMDRLHQAVAAGDPTTVERAAHSRKGQLG